MQHSTCFWPPACSVNFSAVLARLGTQDDRRGAGPACPGLVGRLPATARATRASGSFPPVPRHSLPSLGYSVAAARSQQVGRVQRQCSRRPADFRRSSGGPENLSPRLIHRSSTQGLGHRGGVRPLSIAAVRSGRRGRPGSASSPEGLRAPPGPTTSPSVGPALAACSPHCPAAGGSGRPSPQVAIAGKLHWLLLFLRLLCFAAHVGPEVFQAPTRPVGERYVFPVPSVNGG
ncbi:hypothetical protein NDU88_000160 [Pleurodeles waltl]|uniref:Uncharacterized protein n=1 Tax=Pleurodeles waltl TaxID=8319 RepID=A0AAV7V6S7_PLEWA|nr:hypothetical protein NDU88_000160 [Pleurodeles waltl]